MPAADNPELRGNILEPSHELEQVIQKNGYSQGQLFYASDKATYTLIFREEVISMHFDAKRQGFYVQGHKIVTLNDVENLEELLVLFKRELVAKKISKDVLAAFDATVSRLNQH